MKRILSLPLLVAALAIAPAPIAAQPPPAVRSSPFAARIAAPGVHLLATPADYFGPAIGNVTVVEQSDGLVVIDTGATAAHGRAIVDYVRSVIGKPVKAVVFTHWHNDHPLGASAIRAAWPDARIIATQATRDGILGPAATSVGLRPDEQYETALWNQTHDSVSRIRSLRAASTDEGQRARYDRFAQNMLDFARGFRGTHIVPPTETFARALLIDDAERPIRLIHLCHANTDGDVMAWLPRQRIVVTGDVVVAPTPFGFFSFPESWIGVLRQLKAMDFVLLIPGHGEPQTDAAYVDRLIASIAEIRDQVGPLARQGLNLEETRQRVDFSAALERWGTTPRLRATFEGYWLTPMIENAWREARGDPIVQGGGETTPNSVNRSRRN